MFCSSIPIMYANRSKSSLHICLALCCERVFETAKSKPRINRLTSVAKLKRNRSDDLNQIIHSQIFSTLYSTLCFCSVDKALLSGLFPTCHPPVREDQFQLPTMITRASQSVLTYQSKLPGALPIAHESTKNLSCRPLFLMASANTASAIGLRQMLPVRCEESHEHSSSPIQHNLSPLTQTDHENALLFAHL